MGQTLEQLIENDAPNIPRQIRENKTGLTDLAGRVITLESTQTSGVVNAGGYNAATNTPTLSADASGFDPKGQYYVSTKGPATFAGKNFAQGDVLNVGDYLIPFQGGWQRRPASDAALEVALATQQAVNQMPLLVYENLATYSEELTANSWTKAGIASVTAATGPDGVAQDAFFLAESSGGTFHQVLSANLTVTQGLPYFFAIYVQGATRKKGSLRAGGQAQFGGTVPSIAFDTQTGQISSPSSTVTDSGVNNLGNGWSQIWFTAIPTQTGLSNLTFYLANDAGQISYAGDGSSGLLVARPQIGQKASLNLYAKTGGTPLAKTAQTTLTAAEKASYAAKQSPQTTLAGYGIQDAYSKTQTNSLLDNVGVAENLLTYSSQQANAAWSKSGTTITASTAAGPDGTKTDAFTLAETTASGQHTLTSANLTVTQGLAYTFSCYVKAGTRSQLSLRVGGTAQFGTQPSIYFNATTGAISLASATVNASTAESAGNNWWRISITATPIQTGLTNIAIALANDSGQTSYTGDGTSSLLVSRFQITQTASTVAYFETGQTAQPKLKSAFVSDENKANWDSKATLQDITNAVPVFTENLLTYSEAQNNAAWVKSNLTAIASTDLGPDGVSTNAFLLRESTDAANTSHQITSANLTVTQGIPVTFAIYAKKGTRNFFRLNAGGVAQFGGTQPSIAVNLTAGTITSRSATVTASSITNIGGDWYRVSLTATPTQTGNSNLNVILTDANNVAGYIGDGASGLLVSSAQVSTTSGPIKYFKTLAAAQTKTTVETVTGSEKAYWNALPTTAQIPTFSEATDRLLAPPALYLVDGLELPIYQSSIVSDYTVSLDSFRTALIERDEAGKTTPRYTYFRDMVYVRSENLKPSVALAMTRGGNYRTYQKVLSINRVTQASLAGKSIALNMTGDSIMHQGMASAVATVLQRLGVTMTSIGTNTEVPGYGNTGTLKTEGHYSWRYKNFIGKSNLASGNVITPSLGTPDQWKNPFQRLATADDKTNFPAYCFRSTGKENELSYADDTDKTGNFYIFDYAYYLSVHNLATPDVASIALSTNDITVDGSTGVANSQFALDWMIRRMKTALPNLKIIVIPAPMRGKTASVDNTYMVNTYDWIEKAMVLIKTLQGTYSNLHVLGAWAHINRDFSFPFTDQGPLTDQNDTRILICTDPTHPGISGIYEYGTAIASCVANLI